MLFQIFAWSLLPSIALAQTYTCHGPGRTLEGAPYTEVLAEISVDEPVGTFTYAITERTLKPFHPWSQIWRSPEPLEYRKVYSRETGGLVSLEAHRSGDSYSEVHALGFPILTGGSIHFHYRSVYECGERGPSECRTDRSFLLTGCK